MHNGQKNVASARTVAICERVMMDIPHHISLILGETEKDNMKEAGAALAKGGQAAPAPSGELERCAEVQLHNTPGQLIGHLSEVAIGHIPINANQIRSGKADAGNRPVRNFFAYGCTLTAGEGGKRSIMPPNCSHRRTVPFPFSPTKTSQ
jgi:hypothetical protein